MNIIIAKRLVNAILGLLMAAFGFFGMVRVGGMALSVCAGFGIAIVLLAITEKKFTFPI